MPKKEFHPHRRNDGDEEDSSVAKLSNQRKVPAVKKDIKER